MNKRWPLSIFLTSLLQITLALALLPTAAGQTCHEVFSSSQHEISNSQWQNDHHLKILEDEVVPRIEQIAITEQQASLHSSEPSSSKYVRFYEAVDNFFRQDPRVPKTLVTLSARRLPYLKNGPFVIFISGGVAKVWTKPILQQARLEGLNPIIVQLPGSISVNRVSGRAEVPELPPELIKILKKSPSIFIDDSYSTGGTAMAVRHAIEKVGGTLDGVFTGYENSRDDVTSIYKTGRIQGKPRSEKNFPFIPHAWAWANGRPLKIGLKVESTLTIGGKKSWTPQALTLLTTLNSLNAEVQLHISEKDASSLISVLSPRFPNIRWLSSSEKIDISLGNTGRFFYGNTAGGSEKNLNHIETIAIVEGKNQEQGKLQTIDLENSYFINALVKYGALVPLISRPMSTEPVNSIHQIFDLTKPH